MTYNVFANVKWNFFNSNKAEEIELTSDQQIKEEEATERLYMYFLKFIVVIMSANTAAMIHSMLTL